MKRVKALVSAALLVLVPSASFATFLDTNTNLSAEWTRMQARVGSHDSLDAITYNPAGTVKMNEGFYMSLQNQVLPKAYSHEYQGTEYEADNTTFFVPGIFALNRQGKWSQFAGINVIGGGGCLEYEDGVFSKTPSGVVNLTPGKENVFTSAFMGGIIGGAYAVSDELSFSLAGRIVHGSNELEILDGKMLKYQKSATGFAPVIGLDYSPSGEWNIGIRHEFRTELDFKVDKLTGSMAPVFNAQGIKKGQKTRKDLPSLTGIGVAYMATRDLKLAADLHICWQNSVTWENDPKADNATEISLGSEYRVNNILKVSGGYSYVNPELDEDDYATAIGKNPYHLVATGFMVEPIKDMQVNFGVSKLLYEDKTDSRGISYEKDLWIIGLGMQYKFI